MQDESMRLFAQLGARRAGAGATCGPGPNATTRSSQRFGRFPHRNALLGRESHAEELEFLRQPGSGF